MAAKTIEGVGRSDLFYLENLELVQIEEGFNHRLEADGPQFEELVEDIRQRGVLQPLVFIRNRGNVNQPFTLRVGERRLRACRQLRNEGWVGKLPFLVREMDEKESVAASLAENMRRKDISAIEEAMGVVKLMNLGFSQTEVAKELKRTTTWVGQRILLHGLHLSVKMAVHRKELPIDIGVDIARTVPLEEQEAKLKELLADYPANGQAVEEEAEEKPAKKKSIRKRASEATGRTVRPGKKEINEVIIHMETLKESIPEDKTIKATDAWHYLQVVLCYANGEAEQEEVEALVAELAA